ncbi:MAG: DNA-directed DNA polymerase I [Thaumarchaeota archaeon]|nr:DNA-directed DNA polymerase I [Nitrososphaerota archaeon]
MWGRGSVTVLQSSLDAHNNPKTTARLLISATYDGESKKAVLKFYDTDSNTIQLWTDNTDHKPYCYSKLTVSELKDLRTRPDVVDLREEEKLDLLHDSKITVTKIIATDPLAIGGSSSQQSIRNTIEAWEADIKYYENYLYDNRLIPGTFYEVEDGHITPIRYEVPEQLKEKLRKILDSAHPEFKQHISEWASLLSQPLPDLRRLALDIEVYSPEENRIPDPDKADYQVICVSTVASDGTKTVFLLERDQVEKGDLKLGEDVDLRMFNREEKLLEDVFKQIDDYPILVTFNGDEFDLPYLYHRASNLRIDKEKVSISLGNNVTYVKKGVHIDLYKTFINRSIQIYAFGNKYSEHTLGGITEALINESKIEFEGLIGNLPLTQLAKYCLNDSVITYKLTAFNDDLLMKLLLVIMRVAKMPLDDVSRLAVSNWIRSMLYYEHRRVGALIPKREELDAIGGDVSAPVIKGKKYKGALVVDPKTGVHFNVAVLDFASLYPSIMKVYNLSYETVRCYHDECRSNILPGTEHWVCKKRTGLTSLVIGSLRDLRVGYYKPLAKLKTLGPNERELFNIVSQALKVILNASYGVMGAEIFPLYDISVADATAALGRHVITRTIEKCTELGIEVVYGDTDSLFLKSPNPEQIETITHWADKELGIELDIDKSYRYVAFSERKKNYMGVLPDGNVDIKGLTGKKSHIPPVIKKAFYDSINILSQVKSEGDFEKAREDIKHKLKGTYTALREKKLPLEDLAFNVMMGKPIERFVDSTPQHVRAAMLLRSKGKEVKAGDIVSYVKTTTPPGVKPVSMARPEEVDSEKYIDHLRSTFDQLLDSLGYEFDEILGATKLEDFFWGSSS